MTQASLRTLLCSALSLFTLLNQPQTAQAGVFNLHQFVDYESWAFGLEPETTLTSGGGFATNFKFTYGITPLSNFQVGVGFGGGARGFRLGGAYTFDFIPDLDGQIGFGLAVQGYYYKLRGGLAQTETTLLPYIHNSYRTGEGATFDPYVGLPFGMAFLDGTYRTIVQLAVGTYFQTSDHFGVNAELGLNVKDTDSYLSFGVTYRD
jgi:hypothetical protein